MTAAEIARALGGHRSGQWWSCQCPAHDDRSLSLSLRDGDRGLIVRRWAGCAPRDVLAELRRHGLLGEAPHDHHHRPTPAIVRADARDDPARWIAAARRI